MITLIGYIARLAGLNWLAVMAGVMAMFEFFRFIFWLQGQYAR